MLVAGCPHGLPVINLQCPVSFWNDDGLMVYAGGGMTVALSDTLLLCDMLRPLPDFSDSLATAATTHAFYTRRKPLSATINTLANALYQVLFPVINL